MKRIFNKETRDYDVVPSEGYGPNKYLVSDVDGNPRWSDPPFYKNVTEIKWDGNILDERLFVRMNGNGGWYKVSDIIPSRDVMFSDDTVFDVDCGPGAESLTAWKPAIKWETETAYGRGYFGIDRIASVIAVLTPHVTEAPLNVEFPEPGLYFYKLYSHAWMGTVSWVDLKRLDEIFMPLLTDANGVKYQLTVGTDGVLSAIAVTE